MIKLPMEVRVCRNTNNLLDLSLFNHGLSKRKCVCKRGKSCLFDSKVFDSKDKPCDARLAILKWKEE